MKHLKIIRKIELAVLALLLILVLSSCSTSMNVVEKALEEGDLVPNQVLANRDLLNEYQHPLPIPKNQLLDVDIAFERDSVMATGDTVHVQVGLTTQRPNLSATQLHLLVFNPTGTSQTSLQQMKRMASEVSNNVGTLPANSRISVDALTESLGIANNTPLLKHTNEVDLVHFVRAYARTKLSEGKHHFVLLLGEHAVLSHDEKQSLVDLAGIFALHSATLSVLAVDDNPEVGFLRSFSEAGNGMMTLLTERFHTTEWLKNEIAYVSAVKLRDLSVHIQTTSGVEISQIKAPTQTTNSNKRVDFQLEELIQGKQHVALLELRLPKHVSRNQADIVDVSVNFFDPIAQRWHEIHKSGGVNFVLDRNLTLNNNNPVVERSLLILNTQNILQEIVPLIENKRYYKAVALLSEHNNKLAAYTELHQDSELQRDTEILNMYIDHLYDFDAKFFQSVKIWKDLSWDTDRYSERYN